MYHILMILMIFLGGRDIMESSCNQRRRSKLRRQRTVRIFLDSGLKMLLVYKAALKPFLDYVLLQSIQQIKVNDIPM